MTSLPRVANELGGCRGNMCHNAYNCPHRKGITTTNIPAYNKDGHATTSQIISTSLLIFYQRLQAKENVETEKITNCIIPSAT